MVGKIFGISGVVCLVVAMLFGLTEAQVSTYVTLGISAAGVIGALVGIFKKKA